MITFQTKASPPTGPPWLEPLLATNFFIPCATHGEMNKNECNYYCLGCMGDAFCSTCLGGEHKSHQVVQIRRSSYHEVIRVSEIQKVLDLTGVQTYIINSARVVFLNKRPQQRFAKGVTRTCQMCERGLHDTNFRYCSLGCKLAGINLHQDMTFFLQPRQRLITVMEASDFDYQSLEMNANTATNIAENAPSNQLNSLSMRRVQDDLENIFVERNSSLSPAKIIQGFNFSDISPPTPPPTLTSKTAKRRKGIPRRAPLGCSLTL